jgi:acyl-coenzyme A synthetase/AMP-(fatty) acid ligase
MSNEYCLLAAPTARFVVAYFAVMKIGAVAVPTSTCRRTADYDYFLRESKARILLVHSNALAEVAPILSSQHSSGSHCVWRERRPGYMHWNEWLAQSSPALHAATTSAEDVAFLACGPQAAPGSQRQQSTFTMIGSVAAGIILSEVSGYRPR